MKLVSLAFALGALLSGLLSAFYWYRSSQVEIDPGWTKARPEPVIAELKQMDWNAALFIAAAKSATLNKAAAIWTALSVVFGALSALAGALASV